MRLDTGSVGRTRRGHTRKGHPMKIFISWSGVVSRSVAEALREWIEGMIPAVKPWVSSVDMRAGVHWDLDIAEHLKEYHLGIICLTNENLEAPWLHFEAGALSKSFEKSLVIPYLLNVTPSDLTEPLAQFQAVEANRSGTEKLMNRLNVALQEHREESLDDEQFPRKFGDMWPKLQDKLQSIRKSASPTLKTRFKIKADFGLRIQDVVDDAARELIITAQNLQSLLRQDVLQLIRTMLENNTTFKCEIVLTVPGFFAGIALGGEDLSRYQKEFVNSVFQLHQFSAQLDDSLKSRFQVRYHPGASSLSSLIVDPTDTSRGRLYFVVKWATDQEPESRMFCLVERSSQPDLFLRLYGHVSTMTNPANGLGLDVMTQQAIALCNILGLKWPPD